MHETLDHLERLRAMGYEPFLALLVLLILVLGTGLFGLAVFFWIQIRAIFAKRDKERLEELAEIEKKLDDCSKDREELREALHKLDKMVTRLSSCPRKGCPMRLPP